MAAHSISTLYYLCAGEPGRDRATAALGGNQWVGEMACDGALEQMCFMGDVAVELGNRVSDILRKHGVQGASVFGSVARREDVPGSDVQ